MENEGNITGMIKELKNSPLYAMSLGGRELYHSNFWAWLMEYGEKNKNNSKGNPFLKTFLGDEYYTKEYYTKTPMIEREKEHRDVTITFDNKDVFVIENKLKSIATLQQLERYKNSVEFVLDKDGNIKTHKTKKKNGQKIETDRSFKHGILTGISEDIDLPKDCGWRFLSYAEICGELRKICKKMNASNDKERYIKLVLEKYIESTEKISEIISKIVPTDITTWNMEEIDKLSYDKTDNSADGQRPKLSDIRMDDLCKKKWANEFAKRLRENLSLDTKVNEYELKIASGFTNKQPLVEVFYRKEKDDLIGIQIQGTQYRRCFSKSGDKEASLKSRFSGLTEVNWFSSYKENKKEIEFKYSDNTINYATNQQNDDFCSYKPSFIYQYRTLQESEDSNLKDDFSFESIKYSIVKDMNFAKKVLEKLKK